MPVETRHVVYVVVVPQFERANDVRVFEHRSTAELYQNQHGGAIFTRSITRREVTRWEVNEARKRKRKAKK
jgi:hypothetical protein